MEDQNRRTFVKAAGAGLLASSWSRVLGANDRVNVAVVGLGGRGRAHMGSYTRIQECRIAALCDVDQAALERGQALVERESKVKPKGYRDMRELFADKDVDAVSMPLPNHWHALATIWACQAGKDVYIEKPASHNIWEGRRMVEAARKYNRMVQIGSQSRSIAHKQEAIRLLREGVIGKVYMSKGLCFKRRPSIGRKPDSPVPPGVDWDLFLGPAPMRAFNELRFKYNWHWFWDTGNGDIGNQGVHEMDIAFWGLGWTSLPDNVFSSGGKFAYDDDQETPNTQYASFTMGGEQLVFEVRGLITGGESNLEPDPRHTIGNIFYGSEGYMTLDDDGYKIYKGEKREMVREGKKQEANSTVTHMTNFLKAVKSRKHTDLTADVEIGHRAAAICHMANASYRMGRQLKFDPANERFVNDEAANELISRNYRAPYVVPEKV